MELILKPGMQLYADPRLRDPYFGRSVLALTSFSKEDGAMGFILNKPLTVGLNQLIQQDLRVDVPVFFGGPVDNKTLYFLHLAGERIPGALQVSEGVYLGGDFEVLLDMLHAGTLPTKDLWFFVGYAGWAPGQLESELLEPSWIAEDLPLQSFFNLSPTERQWTEKMMALGSEYALWASFQEPVSFN